jgi:lipopolysaccharide transport system ATP-binding protein
MKDFSTNVEEIVHKYSTGYQNKSELSFEWNEEAENQDKGKEISPKHLWLTNENGTLINSTIQRSSGRLFLNISLSIREKNPLHNIGFELIKFENRNEVSMFYSFHSDLGQMEVIEKGDYIYKIEIPISYFNEGEYAIKFLAGVHFQYWIFPPDISNSCFLTFSIRGGLSDSPYWIEKRPGVIAPALKWQKN